MANKKINCPECGSDTVVETITDHMEKYRARRCTGLIEIDSNKPLEACEWSEIVDSKKYGNPFKNIHST